MDVKLCFAGTVCARNLEFNSTSETLEASLSVGSQHASEVRST